MVCHSDGTKTQSKLQDRDQDKLKLHFCTPYITFTVQLTTASPLC